MKTLTENLTPFDRMMITEAYQRCYYLREVVKHDLLPDAAQILAQQTGFRLKYLLDNWEEVKTV